MKRIKLDRRGLPGCSEDYRTNDGTRHRTYSDAQRDRLADR